MRSLRNNLRNAVWWCVCYMKRFVCVYVCAKLSIFLSHFVGKGRRMVKSRVLWEVSRFCPCGTWRDISPNAWWIRQLFFWDGLSNRLPYRLTRIWWLWVAPGWVPQMSLHIEWRWKKWLANPTLIVSYVCEWK